MTLSVNIIFAVAFKDQYGYLVLEYFNGFNLRDAIYGEFTVKKFVQDLEKKNYDGSQVARAIDFLHCKIVHKDIKLDNILVSPRNYVIKICNFGLSMYQEMPMALQTILGRNDIGTPLYMAPEISQNNPGSEPVDVWAAGCLVIELYNNAKRIWPFPTSFQVLNINNPAAIILRKLEKYQVPVMSQVPEQLHKVLIRCSQFDPEKRAKIKELYNEFKKLKPKSPI